jgi:hypothetical protein
MNDPQTPTPPTRPGREAWLTVRIRCSDQSHAVQVLDSIVKAADLTAHPIDQDGLFFGLQAGLRVHRYMVGSANIGSPDGDEFERALV